MDFNKVLLGGNTGIKKIQEVVSQPDMQIKLTEMNYLAINKHHIPIILSSSKEPIFPLCL